MKDAHFRRLLHARTSWSITLSSAIIAAVTLTAGGRAAGQSDSSSVPAVPPVITIPTPSEPPAASAPIARPNTAEPPPCPAGTCVSAQPAASSPPADTAAPSSRPATPRLDLSVTNFSISDGGNATVPLTGLELDLYALSIPWLRVGLTASAGRGHTTIEGTGVGVRYGLVGATAALQFPARLSPFVAASVNGGILDGTLEGALSIPGTSVSLSGGSGVTWMYTRGLDVGAQLYTLGSLHLTGSVGWLRSTWRGVDEAAMAASPAGGLQLKSVSNDSVSFKLGIGF